MDGLVRNESVHNSAYPDASFQASIERAGRQHQSECDLRMFQGLSSPFH
jgi:hypothetical protein